MDGVVLDGIADGPAGASTEGYRCCCAKSRHTADQRPGRRAMPINATRRRQTWCRQLARQTVGVLSMIITPPGVDAGLHITEPEHLAMQIQFRQKVLPLH